MVAQKAAKLAITMYHCLEVCASSSCRPLYLSNKYPCQLCAGTLLLVSLLLLIPWNTGGLWARAAEEEQQEPLLQAWEGDRAAGLLPELMLASEDAEKTGEVGLTGEDFWRGCLEHHYQHSMQLSPSDFMMD